MGARWERWMQAAAESERTMRCAGGQAAIVSLLRWDAWAKQGHRGAQVGLDAHPYAWLHAAAALSQLRRTAAIGWLLGLDPTSQVVNSHILRAPRAPHSPHAGGAAPWESRARG